MELIKCRDVGFSTHTWFWMHEGKVISPYFNTEREAKRWFDQEIPKERTDK